MALRVSGVAALTRTTFRQRCADAVQLLRPTRGYATGEARLHSTERAKEGECGGGDSDAGGVGRRVLATGSLSGDHRSYLAIGLFAGLRGVQSWSGSTGPKSNLAQRGNRGPSGECEDEQRRRLGENRACALKWHGSTR